MSLPSSFGLAISVFGARQMKDIINECSPRCCEAAYLLYWRICCACGWRDVRDRSAALSILLNGWAVSFRLKISGRLYAGFAALVVIGLIMAVVAVWNLWTTQSQMTKLSAISD